MFAWDDSNAYKGVWNGTEWIKTEISWFSNEIALGNLPGGYNYKIEAKSSSGTSVTIETNEHENIIFKELTDDTLNISGVPVDTQVIKELKQAIMVEKAVNFEWVQGSIISDTGANTNVNRETRVCLRYSQEVKGGIKIIVPNGMKIYIFLYSAYGSPATGANFIKSYGFDRGTVVITGAPWFRAVVAYEDNQTITPSDLNDLVITRYAPSDESFLMEGKPADAKATGDRFSILEDKSDSIATITGENDSTYTVRGITFTKKSNSQFVLSGTPSTTGYHKFFHELLGANVSGVSLNPVTANITDPGVYTLAYNVSDDTFPYRDYLFYVTTDTTQNAQVLKSGDSFEVKENVPAALYIRVSSSATFASGALTIDWALYKGEGRTGTPYYELTGKDLVARAQASNAMNAISNANKTSWGVSNICERSKHITKIPWTPVGNMPTNGQTNFFETKQQVGIPYSSPRDQDTAVGLDVSIHTFMTAVRDPNSVLYTRRSTATNSGTWYGSVCSSCTAYAMGIGLNLNSEYFGRSDMFEDVSMLDLQIGDMLWITGHTALVTDIARDKWGRITMVEVSEEWSPLPRTQVYKSWESFMNARSGYIARRFKKRDGVTYTPIPYIQCFDESPEEIVYPDIQTEFGDAAVFMKGENVKINVINTSDYTTITVTNGGTAVYTTNTIEPFTLSNVQAGLYTITANGGVNESISTFFVVDATASFNVNTGDITYSSTNATPVMVGVYTNPPDRSVSVTDIILTQEQINAGTINVFDIITEDRNNAKVWFMTPYGTAVWYSETHEKWVPVT